MFSGFIIQVIADVKHFFFQFKEQFDLGHFLSLVSKTEISGQHLIQSNFFVIYISVSKVMRNVTIKYWYFAK